MQNVVTYYVILEIRCSSTLTALNYMDLLAAAFSDFLVSFLKQMPKWSWAASRVQSHALGCPRAWGYTLEQPKGFWQWQQLMRAPICTWRLLEFQGCPDYSLLLQPALHCNINPSGLHTSFFFFFFSGRTKRRVYCFGIILQWKATARMLKMVAEPDFLFFFFLEAVSVVR